MSAPLKDKPRPLGAFEGKPTRETGTERPRKNDCVRDELLADGSMVLYHSCQQRMMTLNPTAALIWECCDGAHSVAMIAQEIRDVFPDVPDVDADVLCILQQLLDRGMIVDDLL